MALKYWKTMAEREKEKEENRILPEIVKESPKTEESIDNTDKNIEKNIEKNTGKDIENNTEKNTDTSGSDKTAPAQESSKASFLGILLIVLSSIGLIILMALMIIITIACAVLSLALMAGGGFTVFEAFANIGSAPLVSLQCMGIGFAVIALGLLMMLAALKCISSVLPGTAELFPKTVKACLNH